jgi:hypothetical protein
VSRATCDNKSSFTNTRRAAKSGYWLLTDEWGLGWGLKALLGYRAVLLTEEVVTRVSAYASLCLGVVFRTCALFYNKIMQQNGNKLFPFKLSDIKVESYMF